MKNLNCFVVAVFILLQVYETDAQWLKLGGPGGGSVKTLLHTSNKLFAGTDNGVFISTDTGTNWRYVSDGLPGNKSIVALTVNKEYVFAGTLHDGIYRSVIGDTCNWKRMVQIEADDSLSAIVALGSIILAGTGKGKLAISKDNGNSWSKRDSCFDGNSVNAIAVRDSFTMVSAGEDLYISSDYIGWSNLHKNNQNGFSSIHITDSLIIASDRNGKVFASSDKGLNWKPLVNGLNNTRVTCFASLGTEILAGSCSFGSDEIGGIFTSNDNGESWTRLDSAIINHNIISISPFADKFFAGSENDGVFQKRRDEDSWNNGSNGMYPPVTKLYVSNCEIFAGTEHGLHLSTDGAKTWKRNLAIDPRFKITAFSKCDYKFIAGTSTGGIYCSSDDGLGWKKMDAFDSTLCIAVNDSFVIAGNTRGIQLCRTGDSVWSWVNYNFIKNGILSLAVHDSMVFAGGNKSGVFRSSDYGKSWQLIDTTIFPASITTSIVVSGDTVIASLLHGGLYRSTDNGAQWEKLTGITSARFGDLVLVNNLVVAATSTQVYYSDDFGLTWKKTGSGLENKPICSMFTSGNELYAGTELDGIWHQSVSDILTPVIDREIKQIVSNADGFNVKVTKSLKEQTIIEFTLQRSEVVTVTVFNLHGQSVSVPLNSSFTAGFHSIMWSAEEIPPGFYYVRMCCGKNVNFKKFLKTY